MHILGIVPDQFGHDEVAAAVLDSMIRENGLSCAAFNTCCEQRGDNQAQASSLENPGRHDFCIPRSWAYATAAVHRYSPVVAVEFVNDSTAPLKQVIRKNAHGLKSIFVGLAQRFAEQRPSGNEQHE